MKKLAVIISSILLSSTAAAADSYNSISNLSYKNSDNNDTVAVDSIYYLSPKKTLGPYDQFEYINKQTNVYGSYADDDLGDLTSVGGEYFINEFVVGASYENQDSDSGSNSELYKLTGSYFFNPDLLAKVTLVENKDGDDYALFDLAYNYMLNGTDYVGVTLTSDDDFDYRAVAAKYFIDLQQGNYLTFEGKYESIDDAQNQWVAETNYYFSKATSVFANYNKQDTYSFGAQHFINKNIGVKVGYENNADDSDNDAYFANMRFQF
ncbi:putative porin [Pseudoalteromonas sp. SWYJZ12]|uniref:putative porin n=1 Tax=Pseudoalteromonas sp. SWYJZ12 TaxID=2792067 RepID=UPI0018CD4E01|nr:putative porin [Pseudoalteromonas sp. SWYJZ12]MBH0004448.1 putative porin [Pseudoalteromonas sp. SWYJZ12]